MPFQDYWHDGDRYVVPGDAALLVSSGVLDRELFNVTGLVRQRYDDARTEAVPLLVEYADARSLASMSAGASVRCELPELNLTALDQKKDRATDFYGELTAGTPAARSATGVCKVWLNKRVRATLDESTSQVGHADVLAARADRGRSAGGRAGHRDRHRPPCPSRQDRGQPGLHRNRRRQGRARHARRVDHHRAGAVSGGQYRGVAPDVALAVGKVPDDSGWGADDSVLAGMRWAAAESGAKVANMSLGGQPTDGQDPMSIAVNTLSRQCGTLFVIAAGNNGRSGR